MKRKLLAIIVLGITIAVGFRGASFADTITFNGLAGSNGDSFPASYTEGSFTVTPDTANFFQAQIFGNPVPDTFLGPLYSPSYGQLHVNKTSLGDFTFSSVDLASNNGEGSSFSIWGYANGSSLYFFSDVVPSGSNPFFFVTELNPYASTLIDTLYIGLSPGEGTSSMNLDNIVVNSARSSVPEPSTLLLLGFGLVGIALWGRKKIVAS